MATKVFKRGGFVIVEQSSRENPIPVSSFDYQILGTSVTIKDVKENTEYYDSVANIQNESAVAVGNATQVGAYFSTLTEHGNANNPSHQELTNPSSVAISGW